MTTAIAILSLRQEIAQLARDMVRLEAWANDAAERRQFARVGELVEMREDVRQRRSALMREWWESRR